MNKEAKKYLDIVIDEPIKIGHWLGFKDLTDLHNDWIKMMMFSKEDKTLLAHRGSYKTTCISLAISNLIGIINPNITIDFFRKTDDDVKEVINQIKNILLSPVMQHFVSKIYGKELRLTVDNAQEINTNLKTSNRGVSQLLGLGIKTSITGKHGDLIITDDIVNLQDRISPAERKRTKLAYMELQNIKNRGESCRFFNTGTPWHKEDAIADMPNKVIYDCYHTGLMTREQIEEIRNKMTPSLFAANYELKHIASEDALFTNPQIIISSTPDLLYNGIAHVDAAFGGEDGTAFTGLKQIGNMKIVIGKRWSKHINNCVDEIVWLMQHYRLGSIAVEKNADKGYVADMLRKEGLLVDEYNETTNKFIKISSYLKQEWKNIRFVEETDPDYINEILDYTENAAHDDSPDSLSSLLRKLETTAWLY